MDFQEEYNRATKKTNHIAGSVTDKHHIVLGHHNNRPPEVSKARVENGEMNSVNIDKEMADLAKSEIQFTTAAKLMQLKFQGLRKAITSK